MSEARSEVAYYPGDSFWTTPQVILPDWFWYDYDYEIRILPHFYSVGEERITSQPKRRTRGWNKFEHYKAFRQVPTRDGTMQFVHSGANYPIGAYQQGTASGTTRVLAQGYDTQSHAQHPFGEPGLPISGLPAYISEQENGDFLPRPGDYPILEAQALRHMLPGIKAELSLINSIIELKDFKSVAKTAANAAKLAVKRGFTMRQQFRRAYRSIRRIVNNNVPIEATAASLHLQLQFNILPLISDVIAIRNAIARTEEQVRKLVNRAGIPQTTHYTRRLSAEATIEDSSGEYVLVRQPEDLNLNFLQYQRVYLSRKSVPDESVFHAEMDYSFEFSKWQVEHAQLLGLLDGLGVNLNPAIIWNAIPWSFVVDWLVGVSRWLSDRKTLNMEPRINIRGYLWSFKRSRWIYPWAVVKRNFVPNDQLPALSEWFFQPRTTLGAVRETSYKRMVEWPSTSSIESSGVSLNELTLGSALVIARRRLPKRKR